MPLGILQKKKVPSKGDGKVLTSTINRTLNKRSRKKQSSLPWGIQRRGYRRADESSSEEETASFDEDSYPEEDFFQRFHVTVVNTAGESRHQDTTRVRDNIMHNSLHTPETEQLFQGRKQVRFHKYDHVRFLGGDSEYVYSLYDREVEEETTTHDFAEEIGEVVGDVSYFFNCIQQGLQDAAGREDSYDDQSILSDSGSLSSTSISSV